MPALNLLERSMEETINAFLSQGSIFKPNKYYVGFYGPYIEETLVKLNQEAKQFNSTELKVQKSTNVSLNALKRWSSIHVDPTQNLVDLRWTCKEAVIPHVKPKIKESFTVDALKSIQYPLIESYGGAGTVRLTIKEDRNMMMYQFFNTLMNRFFRPQILKPRSSFQKLGMYIAVLQEDFITPKYDPSASKENGEKRKAILDSVVVQIFEFNSIVPKGMSDLKLSSAIPTKGSEFTIDFQVPNTFQGGFKTTFKGLRDYTTDAEFLTALDEGTLRNGKYIESAFEVNDTDLKTTTNGYYKNY